MEEFVARENIRRFEAKLSVCADEMQRATLAKLLKEERRRLKEIQSGAVLRSRNPAQGRNYSR